MNYQRIYNQLIERSRTRIPPEGYIEHHHIVPRCMNGSNDKENIAILTPEEHFIAHVLLVKMYPKHAGLILGVFKMCHSSWSTKGRKRRKLYGWLKRRHAEYMKERMKGENNPNYGKHWIWIHKGNENRKIEKTNFIPDGWEKGRKIIELEGSKQITNGKENKILRKNEVMPEGWFYGRLSAGKLEVRRNNNKCKICGHQTSTAQQTMCVKCRSIINGARSRERLQSNIMITNGKETKMIPKENIIPIGWKIGRHWAPRKQPINYLVKVPVLHTGEVSSILT